MGFYDSSQTTQTSSDVQPMDRPREFETMFDEFMGNYFGTGEKSYKDQVKTAYDEEQVAKQKYLDVNKAAMGTHSNLLTNLINKEMSGEAVGPYGADIDRLLATTPQENLPWQPEMKGILDTDRTQGLPYGTDIASLLADDPRVNKLLDERAGVSFGGGSPIEFMTGAQQRTIGDLLSSNTNRLSTLSGERQNQLGTLSAADAANLKTLSGERSGMLKDLLAANSGNLSTLTGAQRAGLQNITDMSSARTGADIAPSEAAFELFTPSNQANLSYLQDLWGKVQPMETMRFGFPSQTATSTTEGTPSSAGKLNFLGNAFNLATDAIDWFN